MENRWSDVDAGRFVERYGGTWGEALALRVYTSRLIGSEPALVMHGGGNTSVKDGVTDRTGARREAVFVKGSGWNLDTIEPEGLPGLDLAYLRRLRQLEALSDEDMVNELRTHLFRADAPTPSVETLLHAFLPETYVDHSHAEAILGLTNRAGGERLVGEALGDRVVVVPYVMPGFALARVVADRYDTARQEGRTLDGLVLLKHGLFTFGPDAQTAYTRHIELVTLAESFTKGRGCSSMFQPAAVTPEGDRRSRAARLAPLIRGALSRVPAGRPMIVEYRTGDSEAAFVDSGDEARRAADAGPMTPDHVIRTKPLPLWLDIGNWAAADRLADDVDAGVRGYADRYEKYFKTQGPGRGRTDLTRLDAMPRVVLVPGCGLFAAGLTTKDAAVAADLYQQTIRMKTASAGLGPYEGLPEPDLFDMEYWSLEQAKLGRTQPPALAGHIAFIAGGGGPIGLGVARQLARSGAVVAVADIDEAAGRKTVEAVRGEGGSAMSLTMDVTDPKSIASALDRTALRFGGLDIVVINAGQAHVQSITEMDPEAFRRVTDVNLFGTMHMLKASAGRLKRQGLGGDIVLVSSKNVFAPGADFGAYSASKAGAHQLMRIAALELAADDIRVNAVMPDAVFGDAEVPSGLWKAVGPDRARSRGLDVGDLPAFYRERNLLKTVVTGDDVGRAVAFFVHRNAPMTGVALPVDGGVAAAFPR